MDLAPGPLASQPSGVRCRLPSRAPGAWSPSPGPRDLLSSSLPEPLAQRAIMVCLFRDCWGKTSKCLSPPCRVLGLHVLGPCEQLLLPSRTLQGAVSLGCMKMPVLS